MQDEGFLPDCDHSTGSGVLDIFDFLCFQNLFVNCQAYVRKTATTSSPRTSTSHNASHMIRCRILLTHLHTLHPGSWPIFNLPMSTPGGLHW